MLQQNTASKFGAKVHTRKLDTQLNVSSVYNLTLYKIYPYRLPPFPFWYPSPTT